MKALEMTVTDSIFLNGVEYQLEISDDQIVSLRRFNTTYKMWVVMKFSDVDHGEAELLSLLQAEYIRKQLSQ